MALVDAVVVAVELLEDGVVRHEDGPTFPKPHGAAHLGSYLVMS